MEKLIRYKLLTQSHCTREGYSNKTKWVENKWVEAKGHGGLCTDGVVHFYSSPEIASFMNPVHANIENPIFAEIEVESIVEETQTKGGAKRARLLRIIQSITPTLTQRVAFGILCAKHVYKDAGFICWADDWLSGKNRSLEAAKAAAKAAVKAAKAAAEAAKAAVKAAKAAAEAAKAAAEATDAAAAYAAAEAAKAAAEADSKPSFRLQAIALIALRDY